MNQYVHHYSYNKIIQFDEYKNRQETLKKQKHLPIYYQYMYLIGHMHLGSHQQFHFLNNTMAKDLSTAHMKIHSAPPDSSEDEEANNIFSEIRSVRYEKGRM